MTRSEYGLSVAAEEAMELGQRLIKAQRFGIDQVQPTAHDDGKTDTSTNPEGLSNKQRILNEFYHLVASMDALGLLHLVIDDRLNRDVILYLPLKPIQDKQRKVIKYERVAQELGILTMNDPAE